MIGTQRGAGWLGLIALLGGGCMANLANGLEDAIEQLELDDPFEANVAVDGVERAPVRAGLFAKTVTAPTVGVDGTTSTGDVDLSVDTADGRIEAYLPSDAASASLQPLQAAAMDGEHVTFTQPDLSADTELVAVVWYDDDGDGALDLNAEGESEAARTIARDHEGTPHYLSYYSYDAQEDTYSATAVSGTSNIILSRDEMDGWSVMIDRATDEPG